MKKKASNIFSGKATIIPAGESLQSRFDKAVGENHKASLPRSHKKKVSTVLPATEFGASFWKSTGHPATILYKKLPDDMILITGFENFMDADAILDKYGRRVAFTYTSYSYNMSGVAEIIFLVGLPGIISVRIGYVCSKDTFSKIIAHVKKCGGLLHDIIQACDKGEVKRIEI